METTGHICPIHREPLVQRTGIHGVFLGCPEYAPKGCRYVYKEGKPNINAEIFVKLEVIESKIDEMSQNARKVADYIEKRQVIQDAMEKGLGRSFT